ncbi:MAG: SRPBCC family protein [bacterium]
MPDIIHRIGIARPASEVFAALTTDEGLSRWWTNDTTGAGDVGSIIQFSFNDTSLQFEVTELEADSLVHWKHRGTMPDAWMGTDITFQLTPQKDQTYVLFKHAHWKEATDFMAHCSTKWAVFMLSLKDVLETGQGQPFPNDIHIDHDE